MVIHFKFKEHHLTAMMKKSEREQLFSEKIEIIGMRNAVIASFFVKKEINYSCRGKEKLIRLELL